VVTSYQIGDILRLKKAHPCGSFLWEVYRLGADIGLHCKGCGRRVLLPRHQLLRRVRQVMARQGGVEGGKGETDSIDTP